VTNYSTNLRAPVVFISHGAPSVALEDDEYTRALGLYGASVQPKAVIVVSAHWEARGPVRVNVAAAPDLIYDFSGFPEALYAIRYQAPGSPEVAGAVVGLLEGAGIAVVREATRGWDHGLWVPLRLLFPDAAVPIVEVSLPVPRTPESISKIGAALEPLRDQGVMLVGSGGVVHNLRRLSWGGDGAVEPWARVFDEWVAERIERRDFDEVGRYGTDAPHPEMAVPTTEHFDPLFFALGATTAKDRLDTIYAGFSFGSISMRSFAFSS
jgi:4,5-DOPA dioxygenase extradiol